MAPNTRVNCVVPGFVPTHFTANFTTNDATVSVFCPKEGFSTKQVSSTHLECIFFLCATAEGGS